MSLKLHVVNINYWILKKNILAGLLRETMGLDTDIVYFLLLLTAPEKNRQIHQPSALSVKLCQKSPPPKFIFEIGI